MRGDGMSEPGKTDGLPKFGEPGETFILHTYINVLSDFA